MDTREFAQGYQTPANHEVRRLAKTEAPAVSELMVGPRKWSSFFDGLLEHYLTHGKSEQPAEDMKALVSDYLCDWSGPFLYDTVMGVRSEAIRAPDSQQAVNELHFHVMNRELAPMWLRIIDPEATRPLTADDIFVMQAGISLHSSEIFNTARATEKKEQATGEKSGIVDCYLGQLTENDTLIVGLELVKKQIEAGNPSFAILPAPHKYEAGFANKHRSADFIFIDTELEQVRGIQTKVRVYSLDEKRDGQQVPSRRAYDEDFVTMIDGYTDLGNSRAVYKGGGKWISVSTPGLISLDFLNHEMPMQKLKKHPYFGKNLNQVMIGKGIAREFADGRKPYLQKAAAHMGERLIHDLYKETSPAA